MTLRSVGPAATRIIRELAPTQPIEHVMTVTQIRDESVGPRRLNATLVGAFGFLALVVAAIGIAAVLAFSVSARTNEIGIRMSLGADANRVLWMVVSEGGRLVVFGLVIGVLGSLLTAKLIQGLLFGVPGRDPITLVAVLGADDDRRCGCLPRAGAARGADRTGDGAAGAVSVRYCRSDGGSSSRLMRAGTTPPGGSGRRCRVGPRRSLERATR